MAELSYLIPMRSLAVIALALVVPGWCLAQADKPVPKPEVKVDDRWVYRRTAWTPEWNSVNAVDAGIFEIEKGMLQFPLSIGREYPAVWEIRRPRVKRWVKTVYKDPEPEVDEELFFYRVQ